MSFLISLIIIVVVLWAIEHFYLHGGSQAEYPEPADSDVIQVFDNLPGSGPEQLAINEAVAELTRQMAVTTRNRDIRASRALIDSISEGRKYNCEFIPSDAGGVPAEWVLAPGADRSRRLLYIHGGGFIMGSPRSHRSITSRFAETTGCVVLAIDYRLLPEHKHIDCLEDCRKAYQWILENGPDGPEDIRQLFISGDSAGGNLSLSVTAWARDEGLRMPDAIVAISPLTDFTFSGPSIRSKENTDIMLKSVIGPLNRMPRFVRSLWVLWVHRMRPSNPVASPLLGELSGLPPVLVQASEAEMLLDDARHYVHKAHASGTPATLQTWPDMVHVFQLFNPELPQAEEAWGEIGRFLNSFNN
jgi:acetyl esterase/lipase